MGREIRDCILWQVNQIRGREGKSPLFLHEELSYNAQKHAQWLLDSGLWKKPDLSDEEAHYNPFRRQNEYAENFAAWWWDGDTLEGIIGKMINRLKDSAGHHSNMTGNFTYLGAEIACNSEGVVLIQRFS